MVPVPRGSPSSIFLGHRKEILRVFGRLVFPGEEAEEATARMKRITTAYHMGASPDFWKKEYGDCGISLRGARAMLSSGDTFSVEELRRELELSAGWMEKHAPSMLEYMSQRGFRRDRRKRKHAYRPGLALQSYILQEAEAVGREAKLREAADQRGPLGRARVVSLQHDGVSLLGVPDHEQVAWAARLSDAVSAACGYRVSVDVKACNAPEFVD